MQGYVISDTRGSSGVTVPRIIASPDRSTRRMRGVVEQYMMAAIAELVGRAAGGVRVTTHSVCRPPTGVAPVVTTPSRTGWSGIAGRPSAIPTRRSWPPGLFRARSQHGRPFLSRFLTLRQSRLPRSRLELFRCESRRSRTSVPRRVIPYRSRKQLATPDRSPRCRSHRACRGTWAATRCGRERSFRGSPPRTPRRCGPWARGCRGRSPSPWLGPSSEAGSVVEWSSLPGPRGPVE